MAEEPAAPAAEEGAVEGNGMTSSLFKEEHSSSGYQDKPWPSLGPAISSSAAVARADTAHTFIRTADLRFRVKDVVQATLGIEDIAGAHGGWVANTRLRAEPRGQYTIPVSADSALEISRYDMVNTMTLRVPSGELDTVLRHIGKWVDLFEERTINAEDITLKALANEMARRRAAAHSGRVTNAIDDQGRKLKETLTAEEALRASDERRDEAILQNLSIADHVAFSTVTIDVHQRTLVRRELIANERNIEGYRPSLGARLLDALRSGWRVLESILTALVSIWPVLLLLGGALWLLRRNMRNRSATPKPPVPPLP